MDRRTLQAMLLHDDPLLREELIRKYLLRRLDAQAAEAFEGHYLVCQECFEEMRVTRLMMAGLAQCGLERRRLADVVVLEFTGPVQLVRQSQEGVELLQNVLEQRDTKVLIDLSRVSRIDSAGLGLLMNCYSHTIRNRGMLKFLNPSAQVQSLLKLTRLDSIVETYHDEHQALDSFRRASRQ